MPLSSLRTRSRASSSTAAAGVRWRDFAACLDLETDLFFPIGSTGPAETQIQEAKAVCHDCPVRDACLDWAVEFSADHGVWGGLSEDERRARQRRLSRGRSLPPRVNPVTYGLAR